MLFPSRASSGCCEEDFTTGHADLPQGGGDAQRRTLSRSTEALPEQVAVGARAVAPPQHRERMYLLVTEHNPGHRGRSEATAGPCRGCGWCGPSLRFRVGVWAGPGQELFFSPGLSDPVVRSLGPHDRGCQGS